MVQVMVVENDMGYIGMTNFMTKNQFKSVFFQSINRSRLVLNGPVVVAQCLGRSGCGCSCWFPHLSVQKLDWTGPANTMWNWNRNYNYFSVGNDSLQSVILLHNAFHPIIFDEQEGELSWCIHRCKHSVCLNMWHMSGHVNTWHKS